MRQAYVVTVYRCDMRLIHIRRTAKKKIVRVLVLSRGNGLLKAIFCLNVIIRVSVKGKRLVAILLLGLRFW